MSYESVSRVKQQKSSLNSAGYSIANSVLLAPVYNQQMVMRLSV